MKSKMFLLVASLPLGACGTMSLGREPVQVVQPLVIPAECRVDPVGPEPVDAPVLPDLPPANAPTYLAVRTQRAELAGLYFQGERDAERVARVTNSETQAACAAWAREH